MKLAITQRGLETSWLIHHPKPHLRLTAQIASARFGLSARLWHSKSTESVERSKSGPFQSGSGNSESPIWRLLNDFRRNSGGNACSLIVSAKR